MSIVVRTDDMAGRKLSGYLKNVMFATKAVDGKYTPAKIENGMVVKIEGLVTGKPNVYWAIAPDVDTPLAELAVIASPEWLDDNRKKNLSDFENPAGEPARAYKFMEGHCYSVTLGAFANEAADAPVVGDLVEVASDSKVKAVATLTKGTGDVESTQIGRVTIIERSQGYTFYVIES